MAKWTDNIDGEPYTSRGVRTVRRRAFGNTTIVIWQGAGCLAYIVANRIDSNGKNTSKHFHNYVRTGEFCRRMEQRLELIQAPEMKINKRQELENMLTDKQHLKLKSSIDQLLNTVVLIDELKAKLLTQGYKTYVGRGIAFYHMRKNIKIKGSDLGRSYSLASIEKRLAQNIGIEVKEQLQQQQKRQKKQGLGI
nr:relaxase/mobilization nuclease domain-containing protein [Dyadobacter endophyticus]